MGLAAVCTFPKLRRRRGGRRKGERHARVYGTDELLALFACADVPTLISRMGELGLRPHVSTGDGFVADSDYAWPPELRAQAKVMFPRGQQSPP